MTHTSVFAKIPEVDANISTSKSLKVVAINDTWTADKDKARKLVHCRYEGRVQQAETGYNMCKSDGDGHGVSFSGTLDRDVWNRGHETDGQRTPVCVQVFCSAVRFCGQQVGHNNGVPPASKTGKWQKFSKILVARRRLYIYEY